MDDLYWQAFYVALALVLGFALGRVEKWWDYLHPRKTLTEEQAASERRSARGRIVAVGSVVATLLTLVGVIESITSILIAGTNFGSSYGGTNIGSFVWGGIAAEWSGVIAVHVLGRIGQKYPKDTTAGFQSLLDKVTRPTTPTVPQGALGEHEIEGETRPP